MTRLAAAELRKIWRSRFFLTALGVLLAANLFLLWFGTQRAPGSAPASAYRALEAQTAGMGMDELDTFLHGELARAEALSHIDYTLRTEAYRGGRQDEALRAQYAEDFARYYGAYVAGDFLHYAPTLAQEYRFLDGICLEFEQADGYEAFLDSIDQKAQQLSQISIFAQSESGYDMANIRATAADFAGMRGTAIQYYPQKGLVTALDFALTDVVAVFAMVLIATVLVRAERDGGLLALVRSAPAGRLQTAGAKLLALAASLGLVLACLYGTNLAYCGGLYGLGPLSRTIQSVPALMRSTWKLTVGQYLGCFFLAKWAAAFICGAGVLTAMLLARRLFTGALGALGLIGANLLIRSAIPATSRWNVVKYANLVSLLRTNELLGGYRNLYWFGHPIPLPLVEWAAAALWGAALLAAFCLVFCRAALLPAPAFAGLHPGHSRTRPTTVRRQEARKLALGCGALAVLAVFAGCQAWQAAETKSFINAEEIYYQYYMTHLSGPYDQAAYQWLLEQDREFDPIRQLDRALAAGEITTEDYQFQMGAYYGLTRKKEVFDRIVYGNLPYLKEHPGAQLVYESGWEALFCFTGDGDLRDTLAAGALASVCFAGLFAFEHRGGMKRVVMATPLGRRKTVDAKLLAAGGAAVLVWALVGLPRLVVVLRDYGLPAPLAPAMSLSDYLHLPGWLPLAGVLALAVLARLAAVLGMAAVTLYLSEALGSALSALFLSALVFCLPPLLALSGLWPLRWVGAYPLFHLAELLRRPGDGAAGLMLLVLAAAVCWLCADRLQARWE